MNSSTCNAWTDATLDSWMLGFEALTVIGLRFAKVAAGGRAANDEMLLMITEKMQSATELGAMAATGRLGQTPLENAQGVLRHYRGKVVANRRRLVRSV